MVETIVEERDLSITVRAVIPTRPRSHASLFTIAFGAIGLPRFYAIVYN